MNWIFKNKLSLIPILLLIYTNCMPSEIDGIWRISLQDSNRTLIGDLEIETTESGLIGYLEGGPIDIKIDGENSIEIIADSRDVRGFIFNRRMTGTFEENFMSALINRRERLHKERPVHGSAVRYENR